MNLLSTSTLTQVRNPFFVQLGLLTSYVFLFGNEMLLTSYYASCLLTILVSISQKTTHPGFNKCLDSRTVSDSFWIYS